MENKFETVKINQILVALKMRIIPILLCTAIITVGAFVYFSFFVSEKYTATVSIIVDNRSSSDTEETPTTQIKSTSDITASRMLTDTYIAIFNNSSFLERVAQNVNQTSESVLSGAKSPLTGKQIRDLLSMSAVNSTEILQIKASTTDPQLSVDICYAIVSEAQTVLRSTMNTLTVNSVEGDNILVPKTPSYPNVLSLTVFAMLFGLCLSCGIVVVIFIIDDTIKATDELSDICGYPILGEIPSIKAELPQGIRRIKK